MPEENNNFVLNLTPGTELSNEVLETSGNDLLDTIQYFVEAIADLEGENYDDVAIRYDAVHGKVIDAAIDAVNKGINDFPSQIVVVSMAAYSMLGIYRYLIDKFDLQLDIYETENGGA